MALPLVRVAFSLVVLQFFSFTCVFATGDLDDEFDVLATLVLEHSFDGGSNPSFSKRGTLTVQSLKSGAAQFNDAYQLTDFDWAALQRLVADDGLYYVRIGSRAPGVSSGPVRYVSAFIPACSLYESRLSDRLTLHLDQSGGLLGVAITALSPICHGDSVSISSHLRAFNSTVDVFQTVSGPAPETQMYIQKMEQEKAQKASGEQVDNRSFLAKYWMYLVPLFLFLMFSSSMDQSGGQGGGNRE